MSRRLKLTAKWKLNPILFQRIVAVYGMPQIDVCDKSQHSSQKVCIMDTRPSECRNRRVQCPVVRPAVLCISSLQSYHKLCGKDKKSERENLASNPSMEIQTLVPPPVFSPIRSTPTSSKVRDCTSSPIQPEGLETQTEHKQVDSSHLATVRKCFSKYQVFERVSKIIFASWHSGTESQYKSCWGKWYGWCMEQQINPVSCNLNLCWNF